MPSLTRLLMGGLGGGALALLSPAPPVLAGAGIALFGLCSGALTLARAELLARHVPPGHFGAANGRMALPVNLAQALTPLGVGALYTLSGGYTAPLLLLALAAGAAVWALRGLTPAPPR